MREHVLRERGQGDANEGRHSRAGPRRITHLAQRTPAQEQEDKLYLVDTAFFHSVCEELTNNFLDSYQVWLGIQFFQTSFTASA